MELPSVASVEPMTSEVERVAVEALRAGVRAGWSVGRTTSVVRHTMQKAVAEVPTAMWAERLIANGRRLTLAIDLAFGDLPGRSNRRTIAVVQRFGGLEDVRHPKTWIGGWYLVVNAHFAHDRRADSCELWQGSPCRSRSDFRLDEWNTWLPRTRERHTRKWH